MKKYIISGVALAVIFAAAGYLYAAAFTKVTYVSQAQLIVLSPKTNNQATDYANIAKSQSVLEAVQSEAGVSDSAAQIRNYVAATNTSGTNILTIKVTTDDAEKSQRIAAATLNQLGVRVQSLYGENNTKVLDRASEGRITGAKNPVKTALMGAAAGVVLTLAAAFVLYEGKPEQKAHRAAVRRAHEEEDLEFEAQHLTTPAKKEDPVAIRPVGHGYTDLGLKKSAPKTAAKPATQKRPRI